MMKLPFLTALALTCTTSLASTCATKSLGAGYTRNASLSGQSFLDAFEWEAIPDPTWGDINYVNYSVATAAGLYSVTNASVILRADDTTVLSGSGPGRNSFRLKSLYQYTTHVAIFDIKHMPEGCGTWPAICEYRPHPILGYREVGADWPNKGEIDIVEGVDNVSPNTATLHTSANCTVPANGTMTGKVLSQNCDASATGNEGCGVGFVDPKSYGPPFNRNGGGWYAIERNPTNINVFFWGRDSSAVPSQVSSPGQTVNPSAWGEPVANFPNTNCDFATHFGPHNIIINLDFCGSWAGDNDVYAASGCPSTCSDFVNKNPQNFTGAYFEFNALNIYE